MAIELKAKEDGPLIREMVVDNWEDMTRERSVLEQTWQRCMMAFLCTFDKKWEEAARKANRSHRYVGVSWDAIETLTPQITEAIFGVDWWLNVRPLRTGGGEIDDDRWAELMRHYCIYQHRMTGFRPTVSLAAKSMLVLGNCPWSQEWKVEKAVRYEALTESMVQWNRDMGEYASEKKALEEEWVKKSLMAKLMGGGPMTMPQLKPPPRPPTDMDIIYEGPKLNIGSIFNYVEEQHPNDRDQALRIMRTFRTKAYLKARAKPTKKGYVRYNNLDAVKDMISEESAKDNSFEVMFKSALGMTLPHGKDKVQLKTQIGTFEIKGRIYQNYEAVVANDNTLIQCEPASLWSGKPVIRNARLIKVEGAVYGIGVIEKALSEADTVNAMHNQSLDAVNSVIQPECEVVYDQLTDGVMKPSGPGARHSVNEKGTITPIVKNFQGIPLGTAEVERAIARHERMTGAVNTAQGSDESATRTARNTGIINTKLGAHVRALEDELITPAVNMQLEMNAQYAEKEAIFVITQDEKAKEVRISPHDLRRGAVAYAAGSKYLAEKQERIMNLMSATQIDTELSVSGRPSPVDQYKLRENLMREILGDAENVMKDPEVYAQEVQQHEEMMLAQQQAALQGGQNGPGQDQGGAAAAPVSAPAGTP